MQYFLNTFATFMNIPHAKALFLSVVIVSFLEVILLVYRATIVKKYKHKKSTILSQEEVEKETLTYFSKLHIISIVRVIYFTLLIMMLIALYDVRAFSFFAVAFGAIIIALRDVIISLLAYPHVLLTYDIGDDIRVSGIFGEVVRVYPLSTHLAGKDDKGDYDGKLHTIPNAKFVLEAVERQEIKNSNQRRVVLQVLYKREEYIESFMVWLSMLKKILDDTLPKRSLKDVGNFKSYAGMKYKLHYDYDEDGYVVVTLSFVSSTKTALAKKESIISFVESIKQDPKKTSIA
ncbi:MAG: hypothetical protein RLZZ308_426 [Candidatus Parcubacteria bacterium]|jgi:hypothetical protein